jgi:hypothetical protein
VPRMKSSHCPAAAKPTRRSSAATAVLLDDIRRIEGANLDTTGQSCARFHIPLRRRASAPAVIL